MLRREKGSSKFQVYLLGWDTDSWSVHKTLTKYYCILIHERLLNNVLVILLSILKIRETMALAWDIHYFLT